jgi:hypothetical protein
VTYAVGQPVRIRNNGVIGKVFLRVPQSELYLVQWPGFPVIEKVYYASDLEPVDCAPPAAHQPLARRAR